MARRGAHDKALLISNRVVRKTLIACQVRSEIMGEFLSNSWKIVAPLVGGVMMLLFIPKDRRSAFGVSELIKEFFRRKRAKPRQVKEQKPRVLVCMLIDDKDGQAREDLYEALSNDECDKIFDVEVSGRSFPSRSAHQRKQRAIEHHLTSRNADVIIHGQYVVEQKKYLLSFYGSPNAKRQHLAATLNDNFEISREQIKELSAVIAERVLSNLPDGFAQGGNYVADQLAHLVPQLRHAVTHVDSGNASLRSSYRSALFTLGNQTGDARWLDEALGFEASEDKAARGKHSNGWQERGDSLLWRGNALLVKGERGDDQALEDAITAYRHALQEWTRERVPLDWAMTQNNLGNALQVKGERGDDQALEDAITAYRDALKERTRERMPLDWAGTQNNLGSALWVKGERGDDQALEDAIACYRCALEEWTQERAPAHHAVAKGNLERALALRDRSVGEG